MLFNEVMKLSNIELRVRVAMLLGATRTRGTGGIGIEGYWLENDEGRGERWQPIEDYPNDIAAAWELAEKAGLSVYRVENTNLWWSGILYANAGGDYWWEVGPVEAETAALAITRAFVLVKEDDNETCKD